MFMSYVLLGVAWQRRIRVEAWLAHCPLAPQVSRWTQLGLITADQEIENAAMLMRATSPVLLADPSGPLILTRHS